MDPEWQRHLWAINRYVIFTDKTLWSHQSWWPASPGLLHQRIWATPCVHLCSFTVFHKQNCYLMCTKFTIFDSRITCDLQGPMIYYSFADTPLGSAHPPSNPACLFSLRQASADQWHGMRLGFLIELFWWAGGCFNEARSCFHPDLWGSAPQVSILWLKRNIWACRAAPEVPDLTRPLCRAWHFPLNLFRPVDFFFRHYTGFSVPIASAVLQQGEQDVPR